MKNRFLLFNTKEDITYLLLSNFKFNEKLQVDYTQKMNNIDDVFKFYNMGEKQFKLRFDFHTGHIIKHNEFYNYLDNMDSDFKNSNAKVVDQIVNSELIKDDRINIIYAGKKDKDNNILKTNLYIILPAKIDNKETNDFLRSISIDIINKKLNDVFKSELVNQKILGVSPSVTEMNILNKQESIIDEHFKDVEYNFINDFSEKPEN